MRKTKTAGTTRSFLARQDPIRAKVPRTRKDCSVSVHFDSETMRDAFFLWLRETGETSFTMDARDTLNPLHLDIEYESPDKVFVGDLDLDG